VLFGSIFGLSAGQARADALVALGVLAAMLFVARPLLFASLDHTVAAARGVPVRLLGYVFLVLVGITAAEATQAVGALLLLGLLAAPAGASQQLTTRPYRALALSAGIAVGSVVTGLCISYAAPAVPPSFGIVAVATASYALAMLNNAVGRARARRVAETGSAL
jgi:zinc/manganese transport system permease protein